MHKLILAAALAAFCVVPAHANVVSRGCTSVDAILDAADQPHGPKRAAEEQEAIVTALMRKANPKFAFAGPVFWTDSPIDKRFEFSVGVDGTTSCLFGPEL